MVRDAQSLVRLASGVALVAGPVVWFVGLLMRWSLPMLASFTPAQQQWFDRQEFAAGSQLEVFRDVPAFAAIAYGVFLVGVVLMLPAIWTLARLAAGKAPVLALTGGSLVILGLFARFYYAGVDHASVHLTDAYGLTRATWVVVGDYSTLSSGPLGLAVGFAAATYVGMVLLSLGLYRARVLGPVRTALFLLSGVVFMGVLKASDPVDLAAAALGCVAVVPLGVRLLRRDRHAVVGHGEHP